MSEMAVATLGFAALLALILLRVPIAVAMALVGVGGTAWLSGWPAALAVLRLGPFERASSYTLVVIPLFVLMGYLSARAGLSQSMSGVLPGIVETLLFVGAIALVTAWSPALGAAGPRATLRERLLALRDIWEVGVLFLIVIGGIYGGLATPVESAAFGAVGALLFGLAKQTLTFRGLLDALEETIRTTAMVFFIVIGADLFGYFMALSQMPMRLAAWLGAMQVAPVIVLWAIILTYIVLGALMDELAMILLTVPIFFPVVTAIGYDPIWFGVVIVVVVQIGLVAPPVGLNVFVIGGMARDVPLATIYRGVMPFLVAMIVLLVILTLWPGLALLLPNQMR